MSDSELEEMPIISWFESESDLPEISSIHTSPQPSVIVGKFSIPTQDVMTLGIEDGIMTGSVSNRGNQAGLALSGETESNTGGEILGAPILTTPQSKTSSPFSYHRTVG